MFMHSLNFGFSFFFRLTMFGPKYCSYLECQENTYGFRCNETCGHCSNESLCSPVNGTCEVGCDPGYQYSLCKEGDSFIYKALFLFVYKSVKLFNM